MDKYYENLLPIKNYFNKSIECLDTDNNLDKIVNMQEKINAYSIIYEICIQDVDLDKSDEGARTCYNFYKENMTQYCQEISSRLKNGNILFQLIKYYRKFNKLYLWLNTIFCYIDRHYVKNNDLKNIKKDLANSIFVDIIIESNIEEIIKELVYSIKQFRINKSDKTEYIQKAFYIINKVYDNNESTLFYDEFEKEYIKLQKESYDYEKDNNLNSTEEFDTIEYFNFIIELFKYEYELYCKCYKFSINKELSLFEYIETIYKKISEKDLLENFVNIFLESENKLLIDNKKNGFNFILKSNKYNQLNLFYKLFLFDENIVEYLGNIFSNFFEESVKDVFNNLDKYDNFEKLIIIYDNNIRLIKKDFNNNNIMYDLFKKKMLHLVNEYKNNFSEVLIKNFYINPETSIDIIKFINDKDYFFSKYIQKLEGKLLSDDFDLSIEKKIVKLIEKDYKNQYTNQINTIIHDINNNEMYNKDLNTNVLTNNNIDFNLKILTTGMWNLETYQTDKVKLPDELNEYLVLSEEYYKFKCNNSRKLNWQYQYGEVIIQFNKDLEIKTIPYIGIILLLFNCNDKLSFEQIYEETNIEKDILKRCLLGIINHQYPILSKHPYSKVINDNDIFVINESDIPVNSIEIKMGTYKKSEVVIEKKIDHFKKHRTEACITFTLKSEKKINHDLLIETIKNKLEEWDSSVELIEKCILNLIEKEYILEIKDNEETFYEYLP
jgi:hypothetical protein